MPAISFHLHREELGRSIRDLSLGPDLSNPRELGGGLLVKDVDLVVGHALLSDYDFLRSIDDKVPTLVKAAVFSIPDSLQLVELLELAEFGADHDWDFSDEEFGVLLLAYDSLDLLYSLLSFFVEFVLIFEFLFGYDDVDKKLSRIGQVANA